MIPVSTDVTVYFGGQGHLLGIVSIGNEFLDDVVGYSGYSFWQISNQLREKAI